MSIYVALYADKNEVDDVRNELDVKECGANDDASSVDVNRSNLDAYVKKLDAYVNKLDEYVIKSDA